MRTINPGAAKGPGREGDRPGVDWSVERCYIYVNEQPISQISATVEDQVRMSYSRLEVRPIAGALGAEIYGANLKDHGNETMWRELYRAFLEYQVIAVRGQDLTPGDLMVVGERFGGPTPYPFAKNMEGFPFVTQIVKEPDEKENFGGQWHSDTPYVEKPPAATLLYSVETPPKGGDTLFASASAAYAALSDGMKKIVDGLIGVFNSEQKSKRSGSRAERYAAGIGGVMVPTKNPEFREMKHPIVRTHPEVGCKALYLSTLHTVRFDGMTAHESKPLIEWLNNWITAEPEFGCRVRWETGQLTIWDNRRVMHYAANDYDGYRRVMRRLIAKPETPV